MRLFSAIVIGFSLAAATGQEAARSPLLSNATRLHVEIERLQVVTSVRGLPLGVRNELQAMFGGYSLDIAEPGAPFQAGRAAGDATLPSRRLTTAGCSYDHCLVYYERGGRVRSWRVALFHWTPEATRLETGGSAPGGLGTLDDVRTAVLSGAIGDAGGTW